jgi:hypothetical protein
MMDCIEVKDWTRYVNHRCLIRASKWFGCIYEVIVKEVSPSLYIKLWNTETAYSGWYEPNSYVLIEDLGVVKES